MKKLPIHMLTALVCCLPSVAVAQWTFDPNFAPSINYPVVNNPCPGGNSGAKPAPSSQPLRINLQQVIRTRSSAAVDMRLMTYSARSSDRKANLARLVEKTRATDPASAAKMAQIFASTDIIAQMDRLMQQTYGMRANNVADAYAMWWTSAWNGAQGRNDDPSAGQMAMVKRQAANALAATPEFAAATDAGKQELAEALLVQAAMIQGTIDTYKSDPAMLAKARAAIAKGAKGMGLDLSTMTLTDEGFVPASRKTGAVEASEETQLADAQPTKAAGKENPP